VRIELVTGDITVEQVDAVVNAANSSLLGGGGVDGAIHRKGGPAILAECRALRASRYGRGLKVGQAVATTAGRLPAQWVIHTVGPVFSKDEDRSPLLRSCYTTSLAVAAELGARSVAYPLISSGVYPGSLRSGIVAGDGGDEVVWAMTCPPGGASDVGFPAGSVESDRGVTQGGHDGGSVAGPGLV
jgi:O-acetyl-ADP-ribose deacetylase